MGVDRTFVMVKPDGVSRGLIGEIIGRIEGRGLRIVAARMLTITTELARRHYAEHVEKGWYPDLEGYITGGPVLAMVVEGAGVVGVLRTMMGATDPAKAAPGTIRGDLATDISRNVVHGSDSPESAAREIDLFFSSDQLQPAR